MTGSAETKPWDARAAAWLIRPFIASPRVMPNHFTALRLLVGLAGAVCFAGGSAPNLAALLIVASNFLDHTDGELARLGNKGSRFGHYFDLASDAVVTVGMFVGIGIGLRGGALGDAAGWMGGIAGLAVALIFQLRNVMESAHGKDATRQAQVAGFEAEDVLYLLPLVTLTGGLEWFLRAAAVGAPAAAVFVTWQYWRLMCGRRPAAP
ncbi:MAG: CDP-alcohol phosphatidyltransferase family protein [Gammaproteobacteria bacterium]|nr:CDP-alcohol phosphatidyltransferase family protein [Gammaproteobacteria bacterium]